MDKKTATLCASSMLVFGLFLVSGCDGSTAADHGQNIDCPKAGGPPPPAENIYNNRTEHPVDVTGDLKVEDDSCTVKVSPALGKSFDVEAGKTDSSTVTVPQNGGDNSGSMLAWCIPTEKKTKCHWSYRRTSP